VVPGGDEDPDARPLQAGHLAGKKDPRVVILPVPVIEVAGEDDKGGVFLDGQSDEIFAGPPGGPADLFDRRVAVLLQAHQGAVQMHVSGVNEPDHAPSGGTPRRLTADGDWCQVSHENPFSTPAKTDKVHPPL